MEHSNDDLGLYASAAQAERKAGPSASNVGGCEKRIAYEYLEVEPTNPRTADAANLGTLLHLGWTAMVRSMFAPTERDAAVKLEVPELGRTVEADDVDYVNRVVSDLKSAKDVVWQGWVNRGTPPAEYWDQAEFYGYLLHRLYGGDWTLRIIALNRESGKRAIFEREADPERGEALLGKQVALLGRLVDALIIDDPVLIDEQFVREGKGPGSFMCDYCPFLDACWPPRGPDDPFSPQSATIVGDTAAIATALTDYDEGRTLADKGKRLMSEARTFLVGIEAGPYGDWSLGWSKPRDPEPVPDCDAMVVLLTEAGIEVPMKPGIKRAPSIKVNRL